MTHIPQAQAMSTNENLTEEEQELFLRMVNYFLQAEKREIEELILPSGNKDYIPECERRQYIFKSLERKIRTHFNF